MKPERLKQVRAAVGQLGVRDAFVGGGILLTAAGAAMVYPPAGVLTLGITLLLLGIFGVPKWR